MVYQCHYPTGRCRRRAARSARRSTTGWRRAGAYFRDVSGWEGADWYAPGGRAEPGHALTWGRPNWFDHWAAEHRAAREGVILMDMSFMAKFLVQGRDAGRAARPDLREQRRRRAGRITYTQWLNEGGTLEADLTVTKLDDERFWVVASDTAHRHVETWMRRHARATAHAFVTDVTSAYAQINMQGPRSRELLQSLTTADLSNEAFPFRTAREIDIGFARVLCIRITYLGELGYELYIPTEQAVARLRPAASPPGAAFGLRHAGLKALGEPADGEGLSRLRPRHRQHRLGARGRARLRGRIWTSRAASSAATRSSRRRRAGPLPQRLVQVLVNDPEPLLFHAEVVRRDGRPVGYVRAASYGHTLGGAVGLAMVRRRRSTGRSTRRGSTRGGGRSTSPAARTPPTSRCARSTTRTRSACGSDTRGCRTSAVTLGRCLDLSCASLRMAGLRTREQGSSRVATYTVNTHEVAGVAHQVTSGSAEIENQLHSLMGQIRGLHGNWQGSASSALQELYARWHAQAEALKETLREIGDQMRQAAAEYEANEAANTSRFRV